MCDFVVLSGVEVCADYLNFGVVYGVGVCSHKSYLNGHHCFPSLPLNICFSCLFSSKLLYETILILVYIFVNVSGSLNKSSNNNICLLRGSNYLCNK